MKNIIVIVLASIFGSAIWAAGAAAETAKQGSGDYRGAKSGTFEILKLGENRLQFNYDETGVMVDAPDGSPFVNASYRALGTLHAIEGKWKGTGSIRFTCANGDLIFGTIENEGAFGMGPTSGTITLIGGTGGCSGITGTLEFLPRPEVKASKEGTYQGIGIGKVNWTLP